MDILEEERLYEEYVMENEYSDSSESEIIIDDSDDSETDNIVDENINLYNDSLFQMYIEESNSATIIHNGYYIGLSGMIQTRQRSELIMMTTVSSQSFFKYEFTMVMEYLTDFLTSFSYQPKVDIILLHINNYGVYRAILKTFWLKIIQRRWKKIMKQRHDIRKIIRRSDYIYKRELGQTYIEYPALRGMMSDLLI